MFSFEFTEIVNVLKPLVIFAEELIVDVWQDSKYDSAQ